MAATKVVTNQRKFFDDDDQKKMLWLSNILFPAGGERNGTERNGHNGRVVVRAPSAAVRLRLTGCRKETTGVVCSSSNDSSAAPPRILALYDKNKKNKKIKNHFANWAKPQQQQQQRGLVAPFPSFGFIICGRHQMTVMAGKKTCSFLFST